MSYRRLRTLAALLALFDGWMTPAHADRDDEDRRRPSVPQLHHARNDSGVATTISTNGVIDTRIPFFRPLGMNERSCFSCHQPQDGWSITPKSLRERFDDTRGTDPVFRLVDGANSPKADVSTQRAREKAYSMLLTKGLIRVGLPIPATAQFELVAVDDPYGFASATELSLFLLARAALAEANGQLGREVLAVDGYQQVVDEMTRLGRGRNAIELALIGDLARHLSRAGQWLRADAIYRRGMTLAAELDPSGNADPLLQGNYALNLVEIGDLPGASSNATHALEGAVAKGHTRSIVATTLADASVRCAGGDVDRCRSSLRAARDAMQVKLAPSNVGFGALEIQEARLALVEHRPDAALDHFRRAEAILAKAQDANPNRLRAASGLARALVQAGDLPAARRAGGARRRRCACQARRLPEQPLSRRSAARARRGRSGAERPRRGAQGARRGGASARRGRRRQGAVAHRGDARARSARRLG